MSSIDEEKLIYLETDEEITAVIDRLRQITAHEIRFVVPKGALILQSLVSLKLLKREADRLGKQIAIVTLDPVGLHLGEQADLSVYAKPKDVKPVFAARKRPPAPVHPPKSRAHEHAGDHQSDEERAPRSTPEPDAPDDEIQGESPDGILVHHYEQAQEEVHSGNAPSSSRTDVLLKRAARPARRLPTGIFRAIQILLLLGGLAFAGYLVFVEFAPSATVTVTLATEPLEQKVTVTAQTATTSPDFANALIPGRLVTADLAIEKSAPTTGKKQVGAKATTTLNLFNYWDANPQAFPSGTKFRTNDGTIFVSTAAATIPGASTTLKEGKVVTTPGKTTVTIEAETAGPESNGKSGTFTIPSLPQVRQDKIYGETVSATAGGTSKEVTIVSQTDLDSLKNVVTAALLNEAKTALSDQLEGERLLDGAFSVTPTNEASSASVNSEAETLVMTTTAQVQGIVFADSQLNEAAVAILKKSIPTARVVVLRNSDTLEAATETFDGATGTLTITAEIRTRTALAIEPADLVEAIVGQSVATAKTTLTGTAGVAEVTINHRPQWLATLPKRDNQIKLVLNYQNDAASNQQPPGR